MLAKPCSLMTLAVICPIWGMSVAGYSGSISERQIVKDKKTAIKDITPFPPFEIFIRYETKFQIREGSSYSDSWINLFIRTYVCGWVCCSAASERVLAQTHPLNTSAIKDLFTESRIDFCVYWLVESFFVIGGLEE